MKKTYVGNAFSLQMLGDFPASVKVDELEKVSFCRGLITAWKGGRKVFEDCPFVSAVGHADTAAVLGVPCNRINIRLEKGDALVVAQLQGGRLPEGSTALPEGFKFKFLLIELFPEREKENKHGREENWSGKL